MFHQYGYVMSNPKQYPDHKVVLGFCSWSNYAVRTKDVSNANSAEAFTRTQRKSSYTTTWFIEPLTVTGVRLYFVGKYALRIKVWALGVRNSIRMAKYRIQRALHLEK